MSEITVASRYAKSLIDLAEEQNTLEQTKQDMDFFVQVVKSSSQLQAVLRNPIVSHEKKINILKGLFSGKVSRSSEAFFAIMVNKSRGEILYYTAQEFVNLYNIKKFIVKASVVSAAPLNEANRQAIEAEVKEMTGGNIMLQARVDPSLIGGFILTVGDRQIDTSVSSSLKRLKKDFADKAIL